MQVVFITVSDDRAGLVINAPVSKPLEYSRVSAAVLMVIPAQSVATERYTKMPCILSQGLAAADGNHRITIKHVFLSQLQATQAPMLAHE